MCGTSGLMRAYLEINREGPSYIYWDITALNCKSVACYVKIGFKFNIEQDLVCYFIFDIILIFIYEPVFLSFAIRDRYVHLGQK